MIPDQSTLVDHLAFQDLEKLHENVASEVLFHARLLDVLVHACDDNNRVGYYEIEPGRTFVRMAWPMRLHLAVNRWLGALANAKEQNLKSLSPALYETFSSFKDGGRYVKPFARTLRMLLFLEALLCPGIANTSKLRNDLFNEARRLEAKIPALKCALELLRNAAVPLAPESKWFFSIPLLMVVSVVYSQCEYHGTVLWEAFGAGRARVNCTANGCAFRVGAYMRSLSV